MNNYSDTVEKIVENYMDRLKIRLRPVPMRERDEFNFSVNIPLADAPIDYVRTSLVSLSRAQHERRAAA